MLDVPPWDFEPELCRKREGKRGSLSRERREREGKQREFPAHLSKENVWTIMV